jgi:sRNA-binding protein
MTSAVATGVDLGVSVDHVLRRRPFAPVPGGGHRLDLARDPAGVERVNGIRHAGPLEAIQEGRSREQRAESREQSAESREQSAESREQSAER